MKKSFNMVRTQILVGGLLLLCVCASASYVSIGSQLVDLGSSVNEELVKQIEAELRLANGTLAELGPALQSCLSSVDLRHAECSLCISNSCRGRLDDLGCSSVAVSQASKCSVSSPLCVIETAIQDIGKAKKTIETGLKIAANKLVTLANNVVKEAAKVVKDGSQAIADSLKAAAETVKAAAEKTVNQAVNVAEKAASEVEKAANKVAQGVNTAINTAEEIAKKAGKVIKAGAEDVADTVKDGVNAVKDFLNNIGRRRRLAAQPTCDAISRDPGNCLFYQGLCEKCAVFGTNEAQSDVREIISGVCVDTSSAKYDQLAPLLEKVELLARVADKFDLTTVQFNPKAIVNGLFNDVKILFGDSVKNYTLTLSQPLSSFDIKTAGPTIAREIFKNLFP